jgi:hypothetical protein
MYSPRKKPTVELYHKRKKQPMISITAGMLVNIK